MGGFSFQAHMAADVADAYCDGEVRLTVDQKILFPNVDTAKVPEMTQTMPFFKRFPVVSAEVGSDVVKLQSHRCMTHSGF